MSNKKVAILLTDGFEESEFVSPMEAMENAGFNVEVISETKGKVRSWKNGNWGSEWTVDQQVSEVSATDYDALMLPGGVINPDKLRRNKEAVRFVRDFFSLSKPVAAICHAPQLLIEAEVVDGRKMTSFSSISKDLVNAGAKWVNEEVVVDEGLLTSRSPEDLPAFNRKLVEEIREGKHEGQTV